MYTVHYTTLYTVHCSLYTVQLEIEPLENLPLFLIIIYLPVINVTSGIHIYISLTDVRNLDVEL